MKTNSEFKHAAINQIKGHWTQPVLSALIYTFLTYILMVLGSVDFIFGIIVFIIVLPLAYSYNQNYLLFARVNGTKMVKYLFKGYKKIGRATALPLMLTVFTALWTVLLIVPGVIYALAYSLAYFIAKDYPKMNAYKCIVYSKMMMKGHKMQMFQLWLSFIGWALLGLITCGIALLWIDPYFKTTMAYFYEEIKEEYESQNPEVAQSLME